MATGNTPRSGVDMEPQRLAAACVLTPHSQLLVFAVQNLLKFCTANANTQRPMNEANTHWQYPVGPL